MAKKYNFSKESFGEKFNEIYFKSLENVKETPEYQDILKQIDLYRNILKNNYSVNIEIIEKLISLIEEKIELEYEKSITDTVNYIDNNKII